MIDLIFEKKNHSVSMIGNRFIHIYCQQKKKIWVKYYITEHKKSLDFDCQSIVDCKKRNKK